MGQRKTITLRVPEEAEVVVIEVRLRPVPEPRPELPLYVMTARPAEWPAYPEWQRAGAVGVHLRVLQTEATPGAVLAHLDRAQAMGVRVGLVIAIHNSRDWGKGTVFTRYTRRLPDGEVIPDYWSDEFMEEWLVVRRRIAAEVREHPALAWVGHDFGLDDESWPAKPWNRVLDAGLDVWDYQMRYVRAAHELARTFAQVPVLAQVYTMYSTQALDVLYRNAPPNLGIKLNGLRPEFRPRDQVLWPYWERCRREGRMCMLEPGMIPTGKLDEDRRLALGLVAQAVQRWKADAMVMQRQFVSALGRDEAG